MTGSPVRQDPAALRVDGLESVLAPFAGTADALLWAAYPDLDDGGHDRTDEIACEQMSRAFAELAAAAGLDVALVRGTDADEPLVDEHWWVRVGTLHVDWTARQFHNLEHPANPDHADLPCPLVWDGAEHPVVSFRTREVHDVPTTPARS